MNCKIYELALQAGFSTWVLNPSKETMSDTPELLKKFAELIVLECANIVQDSPWQLPQGYKSVDQAKLVKKYFGVEE